MASNNSPLSPEPADEATAHDAAPEPEQTVEKSAKKETPKRPKYRPHSKPTAKPVKGRKGGARSKPKTNKLVRRASRGGVAPSTIALLVVCGLIALAIIAYGAYYAIDKSRPFGQQRAQQIDGVINYRVKDPDMKKLLAPNHTWDKVTYSMTPPVGGTHNYLWTSCQGEVFTEQIPNEHAVHSLEHGAVWITYNPEKLDKNGVKELAAKVNGRDYMMMSPYPDLNSTISLQAWGFQLKLDSADDKRIDKFIKAFRKNANVEDGATCGGGVTKTGTEPMTQAELASIQQQQQQIPQGEGA